MERLTLVGVSEEIEHVDLNLELKTLLTVLIGERLVPCVYWQLTDPDFSLLEVGLEKETGLLRKLSVALYRGNIAICEKALPPAKTHGIPFFDVRGWQTTPGSTAGEHQETFGRIRIDESPGGWWTVTLFDDSPEIRVDVPDLLSFGFNAQKEFCEFSVNIAASYSILEHL